MTSTPRSPSEARVPAAPPSCTARRSSRDGLEPGDRLVEADEPAGRLQPEGHGHGLLQERAAREDGAAMLAREPRGRGGGALEVLEERPQGAVRDEHRRGVHDVLARRAAVDVAGRRALDALRQRLHERGGGVAAARGLRADLRRVVVRGAARGGDLLGVRRRDEPGLGRGPREGGLDVEHRLEPGAVGHGVPHAAACEDAVEQPSPQPPRRAQTSKKTVSSGPWM